MKIKVANRCSDFDSYRAARVKSLFNAESGCDFSLEVDIPVDDREWAIGLIVGPSGAGKTSIGKRFFGSKYVYRPKWPADQPIIDAIAPGGRFDAVTAALSGVGLGSVPSWLRPYKALSEGEKYRADLAKLICEPPESVVIDEFSSVVDRQIAKIGATAFAKSWRRSAKAQGAQCVLLSCHYDIVDWLHPDWVFDLKANRFHGRWLRPRPKFELEVRQTDWRYWETFEPHHYLKLPLMVAAKCYVGFVDGEPVCHAAVSGSWTGLGYEARACRLVVMPEWQGAGVGMRFLNFIAQRQLEGKGRTPGKKLTTLFHTSHPGLAAALRRDKRWRQITARLYGDKRSAWKKSMQKTAAKRGNAKPFAGSAGFGGHFRAVQGFRYYGDAGIKAYDKEAACKN